MGLRVLGEQDWKLSPGLFDLYPLKREICNTSIIPTLGISLAINILFILPPFGRMLSLYIIDVGTWGKIVLLRIKIVLLIFLQQNLKIQKFQEHRASCSNTKKKSTILFLPSRVLFFPHDPQSEGSSKGRSLRTTNKKLLIHV